MPTKAFNNRTLLIAGAAFLVVAGGRPSEARVQDACAMSGPANSNLACGQDVAATGVASTAVGSYAEGNGNNSSAFGGSARAQAGGTALGSYAQAGEGATAGGVAAVASGAGSVALGAGASSTGRLSTVVGGNSAATGTGGSAFGNAAKSDGAYATALGADSIATGIYATAVGAGAEASAPEALAVGAHSTASGDASTAVGISADASGRLSTAMGVAASASGENSIALGAFSEATEDNTVSFGNTTVKRRLTNLADGTAATDAATVGQMNAAAAQTLAAANTYADQGDVRTLNEAKAYTDSQIAAMGGGSKQMQEYADSGTAAAIAAASIPQAFAPGGSMLGAGLGHWRGETALSVGGSYMLPSGRVVLRGNASIANRGGSGGGVGVGIAF